MKQDTSLKIEKCTIIKGAIFITLMFIIFSFTNCTATKKSGIPETPKGYWNMTTLKIAYFFGRIDLIDNDYPTPEDIREYKDIVYKTIDSTELKLDIYHSKNISKPAPLLIFIHGGGWVKGDKQDYRRYLTDFAQKGYVTATIQYRFVKKVKMPGPILDVKSAVIWLKKYAEEYHIDKDKIAVIGGSAGAHLAMMIAYSSDDPDFKKNEDSLFSSRVQAVVELYGPTDLTTKYAREHPYIKIGFSKSYSEAPEMFAKASPLSYITKDDPPTLIFQGTIDELVPVIQADRLNEKLKENGVPVEYHRLKGLPHTMDASVEVNKYCQYYMEQFFEKYIPKN
ncbi:MAG: alpha/beta hydrolase [Draconibacterium sp.]|nr:alpha/beta hydrolase [Draconibacterium sp.]